MAHVVSHSVAAMVIKERHLWLNLTGIKERDKTFLLDTPISPSGLFGNAVNTVVDRYQEANKQSAALRELILCRIQELTPSISHSRPGPSVRREKQKAAPMLPSQRYGTGKHNQAQQCSGVVVMVVHE